MLSLLPSLPRPLVRAVVGIWRRRWLVLATAWLLAVSGWLATLLIPDVYESRAQIYINTDTALEAAQTELGSRANLEKSVRIVRTQLFSRDNLEQVIYDAGLDKDIYGPVELERRVASLHGLRAEGLATGSDARAAARLYVAAGTARLAAYRAGDEPIRILERDGRVREISDAADAPGAGALALPAVRHYVTHPKGLDLGLG